MDFETIKSGDFPLYGYLLMLVLDAVLYYLLAIYLDNIVPGKRIQVFKMQENFKLLNYWKCTALNFCGFNTQTQSALFNNIF